MSKKNKEKKLPKNEKVEKFDVLEPILHTIYGEMKELSTKKQDLVLNKLKIKMINNILEQMKKILMDEPAIEFLDLLDEETLPSNSDVVLIIAHYIEVMRQFKSKYYDYDDESGHRRWFTDENP